MVFDAFLDNRFGASQRLLVGVEFPRVIGFVVVLIVEVVPNSNSETGAHLSFMFVYHAKGDMSDLTRRNLLRVLAAMPLGGALLRLAQGATFEPTPEIPDEDDPTPSQTEGPFYKLKSPKRVSLLEKGIAGTTLVVEGRVKDVRGKPVGGALLDFWQCDGDGEYDNTGYRLRGHQFANEEGKFWLETVVPGLYPGRTRHIHVRVQRPNGRVLTTQLYFPDEPRNARDGIYDRRLLMRMSEAEGKKKGVFDFVLA